MISREIVERRSRSRLQEIEKSGYFQYSRERNIIFLSLSGMKKGSTETNIKTNKPSIAKAEIGIMVFEILFGGILWLVIHQALAKSSMQLWVVASVLFCLALAVYIIRCIIVKSIELLLISWAAACAWILIYFGISLILCLCFSLLFISVMIIAHNVRRISKLLIKQNLWIITKDGLEFSLVFVSLAVSLLYFDSLQKANATNQGALDMMKNQGKIVIEKLIAWKIPDYDQDMTIDRFTTRLSEELSKGVFDRFQQKNQPPVGTPTEPGEIKLEDIPKEQRESIIASQKAESQKTLKRELDKSINDLLSQYKIEPNSSLGVGYILKQLIENIVQRILGPIMPWISHFMAGQLFITLILLTPLYQFFIRLFASVITELFIAIGIIRKTKENKEVEQLQF